MDIVAGHAIGVGDEQPVDLSPAKRITEPVQAKPVQARSAATFVAEDVVIR
jgi:hypothetical protein